jgi:hypothetical protein
MWGSILPKAESLPETPEGAMLRVENLDSRPIVTIPYEYLESGGKVKQAELPVLSGIASGIPDVLDAIIVASDLQGVEPAGSAIGAQRPLGAVAAAWFHEMGLSGVIPRPERTGVVLAGDLHVDASLRERGGRGDVTAIWELFTSGMRWVVGVPGNHDSFKTTETGKVEWTGSGTCHLLDGATADVDSMRIAGLGGVIGRSEKPFRRVEPDYLAALRRLCGAGPDLVVLHQSPDGRQEGCDGSVPIRDCLESMTPRFVVSGHTLWREPLATLHNGSQVLNVAGCVAVIKNQG